VIYSSKLKPTEIQEVLELEEVLQEPIVYSLYTRARECLRQRDKKQAIRLAGAVQIFQEMIETQYSGILTKIGRDRRIKEWARISNEMHAAEVEQRARARSREQNLERLRTKKYTYDFNRPPEYALARLRAESTSSSTTS
jgi:hypothetical protein